MNVEKSQCSDVQNAYIEGTKKYMSSSTFSADTQNALILQSLTLAHDVQLFVIHDAFELIFCPKCRVDI